MRFKPGDTVKFKPEWSGDHDRQFTVLKVDEDSGQYDLKELEHGYWDIATDDQLEPGNKFVAEIEKIYRNEKP